jgi:hypothetical protein
MNKAIAIFVAVLFVFTMTSLSSAAGEQETAPAPMEKKAEPAKTTEKPRVEHMKGKVKAVDMKAMTITVTKMKGRAEETMITVGDKTKVIMGKNKEKKALADVKAGDKVTVKYTEVNGKKVAKSIAIHEVEPAKTTEEPAKPTEKK